MKSSWAKDIEVHYLHGGLLFGNIIIIYILIVSNFKWVRSENESHPFKNDEIRTQYMSKRTNDK